MPFAATAVALGAASLITIAATPAIAATTFLTSYYFGYGMIFGERQMYQEDWPKIKAEIDAGKPFTEIMEKYVTKNSTVVNAIAKQIFNATATLMGTGITDFIQTIGNNMVQSVNATDLGNFQTNPTGENLTNNIPSSVPGAGGLPGNIPSFMLPLYISYKAKQASLRTNEETQLIDWVEAYSGGTTVTTEFIKHDPPIKPPSNPFANFEQRAIDSAKNTVNKKITTSGPSKGNLRNYNHAAELANQKSQIQTRKTNLEKLIKTLNDRIRLMRASGANQLDIMQDPNQPESRKVGARTSYAATLKGIGLTKKQLSGAQKDLQDAITQLRNY